ncbi:MAG: hypothetical protein M9894_10825 [Planctomycetes bacterium]|nr:hypothetical protein [Planctomycetota bacterium]
MKDGGPLDEQEARLRRELALIKERWLKNRDEDISYFQEALYDQYNLITVGGLGALTVASAVMMPPLTLLAGSLLVAWEVCWLGIAPFSARFRRAVRARKNAAALEARDTRRRSITDELPPELKRQYETTAAVVKEIRKHAEAAQEGELEVFEETLAKLDYLLEEYARMLLALRQLDENMKASEEGTLARRLAALEQEVAAMEPGRLRAAKEKNLLVLRQRADRFAKSREEREYVEVSLETLENTVKLVRDQVIAATSAQGIASSLDQIVLEVGRHRDHMDHVQAHLEAQGQPFSVDVPAAEVAPEISAAPPAPAERDDERERWRRALEGS